MSVKINSKVKVVKDCGRHGEIGKIVGKEKIQVTGLTPLGFMWRVEFGNNEPDGLFLSSDLKEKA